MGILSLWRSALLQHVRQLMREKALAIGAFRCIFPAGEHQVAAEREGLSVDCPGEVLGVGVGVDANAPEVGVEARLHVGADRLGQRLAAARQSGEAGFHLGARLERAVRGGFPANPFLVLILRLPLHQRAGGKDSCLDPLFVFFEPLALQFLLTASAQTLHRSGRTASSRRLRHSHDLVRHAVGLPFVRIARMAYGELGLEQPRKLRVPDRLVQRLQWSISLAG
jgi:hypothetical protein